VKEGHAELGLAFDGDGDRLGVVTKSGRIIYPDRQLMLFAADVLQRNPGAKVIFGREMHAPALRLDPRPRRRARHVEDGPLAHQGEAEGDGRPLAGEMSATIFSRSAGTASTTASMPARASSRSSPAPRTCPQALEGLPDSISTPELNVALAKEGENHALIARLQESARFEEPPRSSPSTACA